MLNNVSRFDIPTDYAAYKFKGRKQPWLEDTDGKQLWLIKAPNNVGAEHAPFLQHITSVLPNDVHQYCLILLLHIGLQMMQCYKSFK